MKAIIALILVFGIFTTSYAAVPVLSLEKQMQKQNLINKKNAIAEKHAAIEAKKKANQSRLAVLRNQKYQPKTIIQSKPTKEIISKTVIVAPTTITQPPTINTPVSQPPTINTPISQAPIANVDMTRVRSTWLSWYNTGRAAKWLGAYSYDSRLDSTAHGWNMVFAWSRWTILHERSPWDGYYNYPIINKWFQDRGVNPPLIAGVNHSENVSYWYYACSKSDCTDDLINAIRSSYIFFINSAVHSRSVYQPNFTKIGFDVIVAPNERRYYVTVHYMTR